MTTALEGAPVVAPAARPSIELIGLAVRYRLPGDRIASFKEYMIRRLTGRIEYRELWALAGVDLEIRPGEVFGILGRNGAGKSTLLKVIARVLRPTAGRVVVRGALAPMLELGAGFHPDLTGEENVYLNGSLLGHSRALVRDHFDEVIAFAELAGFEQVPTRNYSSGMLARLGFAVATMRRPDILILDEVLAVGDTKFQEKCLQRIHAFREAGTTVLLVSHSMQTVAQECERAAWLDHGRIAAVGPAAEVVERYLLHLEASG